MVLLKSPRKIKTRSLRYLQSLIAIALTSTVIGVSLYQVASAYLIPKTPPPLAVEFDPNIGVAPYAKEFLIANAAEKLIPIIDCESGFKHYEADGNVLKNKEGSSAIGIAQILSTKHPDPKILEHYNQANNTDLTADDFNIETLTGNLGYAVVLYKVRGTRDWECAKF